jgi:TolB-like protein
MATTKTFLLPVVVDDTRDDDDGVPERFREVQWTRLPDGVASGIFAAHVARLLSTETPHSAPGAASAVAAAPTANSSAAVASKRWPLWGALALIALTAGYLAVDRFVSSRRASLAAIEARTVLPARHADAAPDHSIAVLPFVDMSEKRDHEYFSDGLAEELLDLLAKTPGLHVIARTSSFYFKGKQATIPEIAKMLGVANILEGSVRTSGNHLRITTQLVRADNGEHLWSETYDRDQEDIFKIQDDIARAVVEKLRLTLLGEEMVRATSSVNPEAHNLYLQGRYLAAFDTAPDLLKANERFQRALAVDPRYAPAWMGLAGVAIRQVANGYVPVDEGVSREAIAAQKAVELDPQLAGGYVQLGLARMMSSFDWAGAREAFNHALLLEPSNTDAQFELSFLDLNFSNPAESLRRLRELLERDPLNFLQRRYVARVLYYVGRLDEAEAMIRGVLEATPDLPAAHYELGRILLARGQVPEAVKEFEAEKGGWGIIGRPLGYHAQGRTAEASAALREMLSHSAGNEFQVGETYAYFGDKDQAFAWLDRAVKFRDPGIQWLRGDPLLRNLTSDPRYAALLKRLNLSE